jgi:rod shape-determining protein MreC
VVSLRDGPLNELKPPLAWLAVAALAVALIASVALFVGDRRGGLHGEAFAEARSRFDGAAGAVGEVISTPIHWVSDALDAAGAYVRAGDQNRDLEAQLARARGLQDEISALREENGRLRALLGVKTDPPLPMVSARTILDGRGPFAETRLADAGAEAGIIEGNPVLSDHGLVGRVIAVAPRISRIMLLTDIESRIPVLIARTNGRAILTGDGGPSPKLSYLRTHDPVRAGDRILTSGDGGVIPRGLPVGAAVWGPDGWRVALDTDAAAVDVVRILLFKNFSQLAAGNSLQPSVLPPTTTQAPASAPATASPPPAAGTSPQVPPKPAPGPSPAKASGFGAGPVATPPREGGT